MAYSLYTFTSPNLPSDHLMMLTIPFVIFGLFVVSLVLVGRARMPRYAVNKQYCFRQPLQPPIEPQLTAVQKLGRIHTAMTQPRFRRSGYSTVISPISDQSVASMG